MSKRTAAPLLLVALAIPAIAHADPLALPSRVESVTLFPNGVTVRRAGSLRVDAGTHQLVFGPLPVELSDATIRIGGFGPGVTAQSVAVRATQRAELLAPDVARLEAALAADGRSKAALTARRAELARSSTTPAGRTALADADRQLAALDARIATQTAALVALRQRGQEPVKLVTVDVSADRAGEMALSIEYNVPGAAAWRPSYAARLDAESGRIGLDLFANVQQRTGEDWRGVRVSLSSVVPAAGLELPTFDAWEVGIVAQDPPMRNARFGPVPRVPDMEALLEAPVPAARAAGDFGGGGGIASPTAVPIVEQTGTASLGLLATSIDIPGPVTIESGAGSRRVLAAHADLQSALEHHAAPRRSSSVFLAARFRNTSAFPLLAGPAALFVGTDYVGTTSIAQTAVEDEVLLPFGVDTAVTIDRTLAGRDATPAGGRDRTTVRWAFRLTNHRDRPVDVVVLDQLPVSRSSALGVAVVSGSRAAEPRREGDPAGLVRWRAHADARGNDRWTFAYTVTAPRGAQLDGAVE